MYRKVSLSSFHNGKVEYCAIFGSGDIEENASVIFFYSDFRFQLNRFLHREGIWETNEQSDRQTDRKTYNYISC